MFQKWSQNIVPLYIMINTIYDAKKSFQFKYEFNNDMYDVKHKCMKSTDIDLPPTYKNTKKGSEVLKNL